MKPSFVAAALALAAPTPVLAGELVVNGGFEAGDLSGWTQIGDTSYSGVAPAASGPAVTIGNYRAFFGPTSPGGIQQIIETVAGQSYEFSFSLSNDGGPDSAVIALFGTDEVLNLASPDAFGLTRYSFTRTATNSATAISFIFLQPTTYFNLDGVSLQAVPEPATWAMMVAGFALAGAAVRRPRQVARTAA